jgi:DNA-binding response OmpR family regulator
MAVTVVLAVGMDSWLLTAQSTVWKSAGFIVIPVNSIKAAIDHFKVGDFDLVLLGNSFPIEIKERLTFLIKSSGSRTPVICLSNSSGDCDGFADATLGGDPSKSLDTMKELMVNAAKFPAFNKVAFSGAA